MEAEAQETFGHGPTAWLLRLLFFPSGIITLTLLLIVLRRHESTGEESSKIKAAGRLTIREGGLRALRPDEIKRVCTEYAVSSRRLGELEKMEQGDGIGSICGFCLDIQKYKLLQWPCGHIHHAKCVKEALQQDIATCADCGWSIKHAFGIGA